MRKPLLLLIMLCILLCGCQPDSASDSITAITDPILTEATHAESVVPVSEPITEAPAEPVLPEDTQLWGLDLSGMTEKDALHYLEDIIACYKLTVQISGAVFQFSAEDLQLSMSQPAFTAWLSDHNSTQLLSYNLDFAISKIRDAFSQSVRNASISYNANAGRFVTVKERNGLRVDTTQARLALEQAVSTLTPATETSVATTSIAPSITINDTRIPAALEAANKYLNLSLSYTFEAPSISKAVETLSRSTLASFVDISSDFVVSVDTDAVRQFAAGMASKHGGSKRKGTFISTYGATTIRTVEFYGAVVDQDALCDDLIHCLNEQLSGQRTAIYLAAETANKPYGGNYVEIDLTNQMLWVYRNGHAVVSTPIVSGDVTSGAWTGGGVFSIYEKDTSCWLVGSSFRQYVDYWIAFNGNIGIHDASWRTEFGGSIYQYNGSHGCINLPVGIVGQVYQNVSVGMKVIVFGGKSYVGALTQEFTGTTSYVLEPQSPAFRLDVTPKYRDTKITYSSANPNVATVNDRGLVTIKGVGSTTITVTSQKLGPLKNASFTVTITVTEPVTEPVTTVPVTEPMTSIPVTEPEPETTATEPPLTEPVTEPATEPEITVPEITVPEITIPMTEPPTVPDTTEAS